MIVWTPYALCSFAKAFGMTTNIPRVVTSSAGVFAKSSSLCNPVIYTFTNKTYRSLLFSKFSKWCRRGRGDAEANEGQPLNTFPVSPCYTTVLYIAAYIAEKPVLISSSRTSFVGKIPKTSHFFFYFYFFRSDWPSANTMEVQNAIAFSSTTTINLYYTFSFHTHREHNLLSVDETEALHSAMLLPTWIPTQTTDYYCPSLLKKMLVTEAHHHYCAKETYHRYRPSLWWKKHRKTKIQLGTILKIRERLQPGEATKKQVHNLVCWASVTPQMGSLPTTIMKSLKLYKMRQDFECRVFWFCTYFACIACTYSILWHLSNVNTNSQNLNLCITWIFPSFLSSIAVMLSYTDKLNFRIFGN